VLFDEIEKASDALWNLLLGVLDKASLTLGDNRRVDFSKSIIFMTSNLGAAEMNSILRPNLGFQTAIAETDENKTNERLARAGTDAARRRFTPEFINRIDKIAVFNPLNETQLRKIVDIELDAVEKRIHAAHIASGIEFTVTNAAKDHLLSQGVDARYGARHLKRAIEKLVVHPVSNLIATAQIEGTDSLLVDYDAQLGRLIFSKECEEKPKTSGKAAAA
jgi:ATP-dependent Clp protease ATP-binding subunit ClpA